MVIQQTQRPTIIHSDPHPLDPNGWDTKTWFTFLGIAIAALGWFWKKFIKGYKCITKTIRNWIRLPNTVQEIATTQIFISKQVLLTRAVTRTFLDSVSTPIFKIDESGSATFANRELLRSLSILSDDVLGYEWKNSICSDEDSDKFSKAFDKAFLEKRDLDITIKGRNKKQYNISFRKMTGYNEDFYGWVVYLNAVANS